MTTTAIETQPVEITIGWTLSDRANGYSSFDGYQPGAQQVTHTITIEAPLGANPFQIAEACFVGTNAPPESVSPGSMPAQVAGCLLSLGYRGQGAHYSLSTGDTVTVGDTVLACQRTGWEEVSS